MDGTSPAHRIRARRRSPEAQREQLFEAEWAGFLNGPARQPWFNFFLSYDLLLRDSDGNPEKYSSLPTFAVEESVLGIIVEWTASRLARQYEIKSAESGGL